MFGYNNNGYMNTYMPPKLMNSRELTIQNLHLPSQNKSTLPTSQ